jgi:hypothetical protein
MKQKIAFFLFGIALAFMPLSVSGQVVPSATAHEPKLTAGGFASVFQPDYAGNGIRQSSPNALIGVGAFVDAKFNRWMGLEAEGRWSHWNEYIGISEDTYSIGPKVPIIHIGRFTPYGKVLIGLGGGSFLNGHTTVLTYGGGSDYSLGKRFVLRGDFELQQWLVTPNLLPYGGSVGIGYRIF